MLSYIPKDLNKYRRNNVVTSQNWCQFTKDPKCAIMQQYYNHDKRCRPLGYVHVACKVTCPMGQQVFIHCQEMSC